MSTASRDAAQDIAALLRAHHDHDIAGSLALLDLRTRDELVGIIAGFVGAYGGSLAALCDETGHDYRELLDVLPEIMDLTAGAD